MVFFVLSASYCNPLPMAKSEVDALLPEHKEFILRGVRASKVLCAGPKKSGNGGFIIAKAETRSALEDYISTDPYFQKGILHFDITEFTPYDYPEYLSAWATL
ncbi:Uncharacterized conserved protein YciI, contains a putative active-site phosphohistidine [Sporobacter termitidis DSM 10068]|uniref:Uncharacterized conserved protein YciI, contains a putative active-site phosphohistidine n=1 Tax=Sporobacter termitidis DSM 10068 TaxID=1123282 RepID=A0A1M5Y2N6_9FIRM|nr:YciI family protein [Sporobacter termitidis]SHI05763.1 Uncharacterized conserved protein YciI, contains a putative active-site phosphohistidine [Sporobacter termitidis DSM 10068]